MKSNTRPRVGDGVTVERGAEDLVDRAAAMRERGADEELHGAVGARPGDVQPAAHRAAGPPARRRVDEPPPALAEEVASKPQKPGSVEQKVADYYSSYNDTKTIDSLGLKPFEADLARIASLKTHEDVVAFAAEPGIPTNLPIGWGISLDQKNPDRYAVAIGQGGLGHHA